MSDSMPLNFPINYHSKEMVFILQRESIFRVWDYRWQMCGHVHCMMRIDADAVLTDHS